MTATYAIGTAGVKAATELVVFRFFTGGVAFPAAGVGLGFVEWGDVMDPKLAMLIVLFGAIIGLSYLSGENLARLRRWRKNAP